MLTTALKIPVDKVLTAAMAPLSTFVRLSPTIVAAFSISVPQFIFCRPMFSLTHSINSGRSWRKFITSFCTDSKKAGSCTSKRLMVSSICGISSITTPANTIPITPMVSRIAKIRRIFSCLIHLMRFSMARIGTFKINARIAPTANGIKMADSVSITFCTRSGSCRIQ